MNTTLPLDLKDPQYFPQKGSMSLITSLLQLPTTVKKFKEMEVKLRAVIIFTLVLGIPTYLQHEVHRKHFQKSLKKYLVAFPLPSPVMET